MHKGYVSPSLLAEGASGLGYVVVTRGRGGTRDIGVFMVDRLCLGVKNAKFAKDYDDDQLDELLGRFFEQGVEERDGAWCRKFVEGAVDYARALGFAPHGDYKKASRVFGGIKASDCAEAFAYGKDGKPFYIQGPFEDDRAAQRIMRRLRARCGEDGFHFLCAERNSGVDLDEAGDAETGDADEVADMPTAQLNCECAGGGGDREFFQEMLRGIADERVPFTPEVVFDPDESGLAESIEEVALILTESGDESAGGRSEDGGKRRRDAVTLVLVECLLAATFNKKERHDFWNSMDVDPTVREIMTALLANKEFYAWARSIVHFFPGRLCVLQQLGWAPPEGNERGEPRLHVIYALVPRND